LISGSVFLWDPTTLFDEIFLDAVDVIDVISDAVVGARLDPLSLILVFPMLDSNATGFLAVSKFVEGFTSGVLLKVGATGLTDGRVGALTSLNDS